MKKTIAMIFGVLFLVTLLDSLYIVKQTEQAIVLQFGAPKRVVKEAGLKIKSPFVQNVVYYDNRLLDLDPPAEELTLFDKKRVEIDSFTRFRIVEPLVFYKSVPNEKEALSRLNDIISSSVRAVLGKTTLIELLSDKRIQIMDDIWKMADKEAKTLGVEIAGVRIRRADLPPQISQSVYARMRSEREREAKEYRAQGQEVSQQIRAKAERESTIIIAEAQRKSQEIRGEGDNKAIEIWADAANKDTEFYAFYRSLESYRKSMRDKTTLVLSPDSEFFRYFNKTPGNKYKKR